MESLGVDVATQVTGLLVTHWHRDHIDGAYNLLIACDSAVLQASAALSSKEALHLARLYKSDPFSDADKEVREFREIMAHLRKQGQPDRFRLVKARHVFFHDKNTRARLIALSPSDVATTQAIERIRELVPPPGKRRLRLAAPSSENLSAVAMHFEYGEFTALLGSDLEGSANQYTGWGAVLSSNIGAELSLGKASVYKVAHHGSSSGHHQEMWTQMLHPQPLALTTPFSNSRLPTDEDVNRIRKMASAFICSSRDLI